uniref:Nucleotide exchange factor SIL1 n=1 Tax=Anopheles melas TaxID=34690 RepID=A0A182UC03_9DIPT
MPTMLLAGQLDRVEPQLQLFRHQWPLLGTGELLHQLQHVYVGDALLGHGDGTHEPIGKRHKLLLQIDGLLVPPDQLGGDFVRGKDGDRSAIAHARRTLDGAAPLRLNFAIDARQPVKVEACKVELAQIARIVHVADKDVHVLRSAESVNGRLVGHFPFALEQHTVPEGGHTAKEVVHIPDHVQDQQSHQQGAGEHFLERTGSNEPKFVASHEWQELKEGQPIPQGLHVRINLTTGKKEAKLLDPADGGPSTDSSLSMVPGEELKDHHQAAGAGAASDPQTVAGMKLEALREALKDIPANTYEEDGAEGGEAAGSRFKSYEQIKQELKDANVELKSDSEIMTDLFARFEQALQHTPADRQELDVLFEDLEYLAHQIDNALQFIDRGGVEKIVWPSLNRTGDAQTRTRALKLLGTIVQNNPKAKVALVERNGGPNLLSALGRASTTDEISAALYAFGGLVRKFPFAQKQLLTPHGYSVLYGVWEKKVELKVKVKVLQLIADVLVDYRSAIAPASENDATTREQYGSTKLPEGLERTEFCKHSAAFFHQHKAALIPEDNLTDETVKALHACRQLCHEPWSQCPLFRHTLLVLRNNLDHRLDEDVELVEYRREIKRSINELVVDLYALQYGRLFRSLAALGELLYVLEQIYADGTLARVRHSPNKPIVQRDELVLEVDGSIVPPDELRLHLVRLEDGQHAPVPHHTLALQKVLRVPERPEPGPAVPVKPAEVELAQVAPIVHVVQQKVHILRRAEPCKREKAVMVI